MATFEFLRDQMNDARRIADDKSKPAHVRHTADARFWHIVKRIGALQRTNDLFAASDYHPEPPDHSAFLIGYREITR